ncbi:MAG: oligosaccharide flippase family protein [Nitrospirota bacterium]
MQKRQILNNSIMSVVQIIAIGVTLFLLYRFLLTSIGIEQFGIWSLVLALSSVSQIANLGLSGSIVKFVAKYIARKDSANVSLVIQTAFLSGAVFASIVLIISYPLAKWILGLIIPNESFHHAIAILPHALFAVWIMLVTSILQAGIDGHQRIDLRSFLLIGGAVFNLVLCFILVPSHGLLGAAYARVAQSFTMLLSSWLLLKRLLPSLPVIPYKWDKFLFREIVGYSINFQIISISTMCYEPVTKVLLSKFGGVSLVGYFEMATRLVQQFRAIIVSANQVLVPAIAHLKEKTPEKIQGVYLTSYQLLFYLSIPLYSMIILCSPVISELWIGHYEEAFVTFTTLLAIGYFFNTLAAPAYFSYLGTGELRWNVIGHISIGILNAVLGFLLGIFSNGTGVIIAWTISLALGSSLIYLSYHIKQEIPLSELIPKASNMILLTCTLSILIAGIIRYNLAPGLNSITINIITIFLLSIIVFILLWIHPMRKRLKGWINDELLNKKKGY